MSEPRICEVGGGGIFLPAFGDAEQEWPNGVRVVLYFFGLLWLFLGVGIVSDIFMEGIEVITSTEKEVKMKDGRVVTVKVWNATIANLTLMALGSSAPEILLNVIEIFGNKFYAGALGPSTIVGSAAFNLMVIIGVCVTAPCPDTRKILDLHVFSTTAFFSVFAYIWLLIILQVSSPDCVTLMEALITFILFPILAALAFAADKNYCTTKVLPTAAHISVLDRNVFKAFDKDTFVKGEKGMDISSEDAQALIDNYKANHHVSRAQLKKQAMANITGGKKNLVSDRTDDIALLTNFANKKNEGDLTEISFEAAGYHCIESDGVVCLYVVRNDTSKEETIDFKTVAGSATKNADYEHTEGTCVFKVGSAREEIKVKIIDDDEIEEDEEFYVELSNAQPSSTCKVGTVPRSTVIIIDDDEPGQLGFRPEDVSVECYESCKHVGIMVSRMNGTQGELRCKYKTVQGSAQPKKDYVETEEEIVFGTGEVRKEIKFEIIDSKLYEKEEDFKVVLSDISGPVSGITFHDLTECKITIKADPQAKALADSIQHLLDDSGESNRTFADQFKACLGPEVEDGEEPTNADWFGHIVSVPFKFFFATIPPPHYADGKATFVCALVWIGVVTAFIGDMASLFGCCLGLKDSVTAITFVALGTSLPDTFASKAAAIAEDTADSAVGNVTGSNSVNVFLGLGLPWVIAALFWNGGVEGDELVTWQTTYKDYPDLINKYPNGIFAVPAGSLGFSVTIFTICALMTIATLVLRRKYLGGELGGDVATAKKSSYFMYSLWLIYVLFSSMQAYEYI